MSRKSLSGLTFLRDNSGWHRWPQLVPNGLANYASVWNTNQRDSNWLVKNTTCNVHAAFIRTLNPQATRALRLHQNCLSTHLSISYIKGRSSATGWYIDESGSLICFLCPVQIELKKTTIAIKDAHLLPPPTRRKSEPLYSSIRRHGNKIMMADMCRRQLRFTKSIACGHLTFTGENIVDCYSNECHLSSAHPQNSSCVTPQCRRYYEKPERLTTKEVSI